MQTPESLAKLMFKKKRLEHALSEHRSKVIEAERAITLCQTLRREIPTKIAAIKSRVTLPVFTDSFPVEDAFAQRNLFSMERRAVASLNRLLGELPELLKFWEARRRELAA